MTTQKPEAVDFSTWPEVDQGWAQRFTYVLAMKTAMPPEKLPRVLEETRLTCLQSSQSAEEIFGPADAAAYEIAAQNTSAEHRSQEKTMPFMQALVTACWTVAWLIFLLTWFLTDYSTWHISKPLRFTAISLAVFTLTLGATLTWSSFSRGRLAQAGIAGVAGLVGFGASMWWMSKIAEKPETNAVPFWWAILAAFALGGMGLLCVWLGVWREEKTGSSVDSRDWFTQLEGYLRGQQLLRKDEAREVVQEARNHLASVQELDPQATPEEEFGSARAYAETYAGGTQRTRKRRQNIKEIYRLIQALIVCGLAVVLAAGWGWSIWGWCVIAFALLILLSTVAGYYRARKNREGNYEG